jgi:hypothetical protein
MHVGMHTQQVWRRTVEVESQHKATIEENHEESDGAQTNPDPEVVRVEGSRLHHCDAKSGVAVRVIPL